MDDNWGFVTGGSDALQEVLDAARLDDRSFAEWISYELARRGMRKNMVVRRSRLNQTFAYQIMAGMRHPSRDKLIQLCFGMRLSVGESAELLERGEVSPLRPYVRRDVIIAFCLDRRLELSVCDDLLWNRGEATITSRDESRGIATVRAVSGATAHSQKLS